MPGSNSLNIEHSAHAGSRFRDARLLKSSFNDVNLRESSLAYVALTGAVFKKACRGHASIYNARLEGTAIHESPVSALLRVHEQGKGATCPVPEQGASRSRGR